MKYTTNGARRSSNIRKIAGCLVVALLLLSSAASLAQDCDKIYFLSSETIKSGERVTYTAMEAILCPEGKQFVVEDGGHVALRAGRRIELHSGFKVLPGGGLSVLLGDCEPKEPDEGDLKVYPNPAYDILNVESPYNIVAIKLSDMTGMGVLEKTDINSTLFSVDISEIKPGLYLMEIIGDRITEIIRIEKN